MRWEWIEPDHLVLPLATQCDLLGLNRSTWYHRPAEPSALNLELMRQLDEEYTAHPGHLEKPLIMREWDY